MSHRIFNFSAGPAMLPTEVLEKSAGALLDYQGKGYGIAEVSHRGKEFEAVNDEAVSLCKKLLNLGDTHDVVFPAGRSDAIVYDDPDEFFERLGGLPRQRGVEAKRPPALQKKIGKANVVATTESSQFDHSAPQNEWKMSSDADYFHVCSNETVQGHRLPVWPKHPNLIVGRQQRVPVASPSGRRLRVGLRRSAKKSRPRRRRPRDRAQGPVSETKQTSEQAVEL